MLLMCSKSYQEDASQEDARMRSLSGIAFSPRAAHAREGGTL